MNSMQMYELAANAVKEATGAGEDSQAKPDVLWVGGVLEDRRAVVWFEGKLFMVTYNTSTEKTTVDVYEKRA